MIGTDDPICIAEQLTDEARFEEAQGLLQMELARTEDLHARCTLRLALVSSYNEEDWTRGLRNHAIKHGLLDEAESEIGESQALRAKARFERGMALHIDAVMGVGQPDRELASFTEASEIYAGLGDQEGEALAIAFIGIFHHVDRLDRDTAEPILRRAYDLSADHEGSDARAEAARHLGQILQERGDVEGALPLLQEALVARAEGLKSKNLSSALHALGYAQLEAGDLDAAQESLRRARYYAERYGSRIILTMIAKAEAQLEFALFSSTIMRDRTHP
jgi:tetratricopeptide (TPR) repeat protein